MIAAIVLAAGRSTRFGAPKVVAPLAGTSLVRHVVERLQESSIDELLVVAGDEADDIGRAINGTRARLAINANPSAGLSESLRIGLHAVEADAEAILVALGDQPLIDPGVVTLMVAAWRGGRGKIIVPVYNGERGNPVLFDASLRAELMLLEGDHGARDLFDTHSSYVYRLIVDLPAPRDVDTQEDLRDVERALGVGDQGKSR
ncbi:MAG: nucleotidyltransferase family protein [Gemmatimonadaceae bacterium]